MKSAKKILEEFIKEMMDWETDFNTRDQAKIYDSNLDQNKLKELIEIQEQHLSSKALSLTQGRRIALNYGNPPEYQQQIIQENDLSENKKEFLVNRFNELYRKYFLILENGEWKIDKMGICSLNWKNKRQYF